MELNKSVFFFSDVDVGHCVLVLGNLGPGSKCFKWFDPSALHVLGAV